MEFEVERDKEPYFKGSLEIDFKSILLGEML